MRRRGRGGGLTCYFLVRNVDRAEPFGAVSLPHFAAAPGFPVRCPDGAKYEAQSDEGQKQGPDPRNHGGATPNSTAPPPLLAPPPKKPPPRAAGLILL